MDRPDTVIELHRELVAERAGEQYSGGDYRESVGGFGYSATATVTLAPHRVWFHRDATGRLWQERDRSDKHFAIELALSEAKVTLESVSCVPVLALPPRTLTVPPGLPRAGEQLGVGWNEIPLLGRLTVHTRLFRRDLGDGRQTISLDFTEHPAPALFASPPPDGGGVCLFGPGVERRDGGLVKVGGQGPRIVWELDEAEQWWITHSAVGELLTAAERLRNPLRSDAAARLRVLDALAAQLADAVRPEVEALGEGGVLDLLPAPVDVDADSDDDVTVKEIDVRTQRFDGADGVEHESMVVELRTLRDLPEGEDLPRTLLAERPTERTALAVTGFSVLRQVRDTVANTFGIDVDAFAADEPCHLVAPVDVEIGGADRRMESLDAHVERDDDGGHLVVTGRVSATSPMYDFDADFAVTYAMALDAMARDVEDTEGSPEHDTVASLEARLADAGDRRRGGELDSAAYEATVARVHARLAELPQTIGVQPVQAGDPRIDAQFKLTAAGYAASAVGASATVALLALPATWPAGVAGLSALGAGGLLGAAIVGYLSTVLTVGWAGSNVGAREVMRSMVERPDGTALPVLGIPVSTDLTRERLAVYFRQVPPRLPVTFVRKHPETGAVALVGGPWPTDGTPYVITQHDGALLVDAGASELVAKHGSRSHIPLRSITGSEGRRLLVTAPVSTGGTGTGPDPGADPHPDDDRPAELHELPPA